MACLVLSVIILFLSILISSISLFTLLLDRSQASLFRQLMALRMWIISMSISGFLSPCCHSCLTKNSAENLLSSSLLHLSFSVFLKRWDLIDLLHSSCLQNQFPYFSIHFLHRAKEHLDFSSVRISLRVFSSDKLQKLQTMNVLANIFISKILWQNLN